jgi:putative endonuclease
MNKNSYWIYVLKLNNGRKYIGQTNNLERRLMEHQLGRSPYTRKHKIKKLIYSEICNSRSDAIIKEKFLKTGKGREWLKRKLAEQSRHFMSGRFGVRFPVGALNNSSAHAFAGFFI